MLFRSVSLSVASFTAARTLFESLAMITSDNLVRGDFLGARLAPPLQRMQGTLASVESLIGSFAKKGFVKRMLTTDVDARGFARLDKELMAELAEIDAAFGRETLDLQRRTYEHVEQLAHLIESQRAALEAHDAAVASGSMSQILLWLGLLEIFSAIKISQAMSGEGSPAGDYGFDPIGFGADPAKMEKLQMKELANGRTAMLAFGGMVTQAVLTGNTFPYLY